jgi:metal-responsive CopG/Arc/MetJ family transcriptional regulator
MKTAISLPDELFRRAERLARRMKTSRSRLFSLAVSEYLERHAPDEITESLNRVCEQVGDGGADPFLQAAARRVLERCEW